MVWAVLQQVGQERLASLMEQYVLNYSSESEKVGHAARRRPEAHELLDQKK